mgnify:CR=1
MNILYQSGAGEILTEAQWRAWARRTWDQITINKDRRQGIVEPIDSFERIKKILKLKEIQN